MVPARKKLFRLRLIEKSGCDWIEWIDYTKSRWKWFHCRRTGKKNLDFPLLIGGATTSKAHTAVKISPKQYSNTVVPWMTLPELLGVVSSYWITINPMLMLWKSEKIMMNSVKNFWIVKLLIKNMFDCRSSWRNSKSIGKMKLYQHRKIRNHYYRRPKFGWIGWFIDWSPFLEAGKLFGKFPDILTDNVVGEQATILFNEAQKMLKKSWKKRVSKRRVFWNFPWECRWTRMIFWFWWKSECDFDFQELFVSKHKNSKAKNILL